MVKGFGLGWKSGEDNIAGLLDVGSICTEGTCCPVIVGMNDVLGSRVGIGRDGWVGLLKTGWRDGCDPWLGWDFIVGLSVAGLAVGDASLPFGWDDAIGEGAELKSMWTVIGLCKQPTIVQYCDEEKYTRPILFLLHFSYGLNELTWIFPKSDQTYELD